VADVFTELPTKEDLLGRFNHIQNKTQTILSGPSGVPGHPPDRERLRRGTYVVDDDFYVQHGGAPVPTKSAVATDDGDSSGAFENGPQTLRADGRDLTRPAPPTWQPSGRSTAADPTNQDDLLGMLIAQGEKLRDQMAISAYDMTAVNSLGDPARGGSAASYVDAPPAFSTVDRDAMNDLEYGVSDSGAYSVPFDGFAADWIVGGLDASSEALLDDDR
jgi:hypothetical protein